MNLDFSNTKILVVGDVMLDSYWQGSTDRISPEAPVPVVHVNDMTRRIGGSGNVALNIATLGAKAELFALISDDKEGLQLSELLSQSHVINRCQIDNNIPTTTKLRVLSQHQQLIRLDFEEEHQDIDISALLNTFEESLPDTDLVILSDYGKGLLHDPQPFITLANNYSVKVLIDPKKDSFLKYSNAWMLTPNQKEFELVVGECVSQNDLEEKARNLIKECHLGGLLITQGGQGMTLVMKGEPVHQFSAHAKEVYDVTGAGDTVIASLATAMASGMAVKDAVHLSSKAAAIVVGRIGTSSVSIDDLLDLERRQSHKLSSINNKILDQTSCLDYVEQLKKTGKKIVFTNGCFDLLHAGHVTYLEKASQLGDMMIVAVNSDESVKQLKGESRPINSLKDRMTVLASLASVDVVVEFSEETPEKLICSMSPDVLVKGGDYQIDEIAGKDCVSEVVLIDVVADKSSSNIINKINHLKL